MFGCFFVICFWSCFITAVSMPNNYFQLVNIECCGAQSVECGTDDPSSMQGAASSVVRLLCQVSPRRQEDRCHRQLWSTYPCLASWVWRQRCQRKQIFQLVHMHQLAAIVICSFHCCRQWKEVKKAGVQNEDAVDSYDLWSVHRFFLSKILGYIIREIDFIYLALMNERSVKCCTAGSQAVLCPP